MKPVVEVPDVDWTSPVERRSIPIHVLNHVSERLHEHTVRVEGAFEKHTAEEMERYTDILTRIEKNNEENISRHGALLDSVKALAFTTEQVHDAFKEAFPLDAKGRPDFHGHAQAHYNWIEESQERKEFLKHIKRVVTSAAFIALGSWVGMLVWQGVLHGPVK